MLAEMIIIVTVYSGSHVAVDMEVKRVNYKTCLEAQKLIKATKFYDSDVHTSFGVECVKVK